MNNKAKKPVLFLLCLTASLAALSACGKKTTKATTEKPITTDKQTTNKPTTKEKITKVVTNNPVVFFIVDGEIYEQIEYTPNTASIKEPTIPSKEGYQISKWSDYNLTGEDVYVFAMYFKINTKYTVEYYLQNLDNDEYTLNIEDTQTFTTTPDQVIKPNIKTYEGFSCINNDVELNIVEDETKNTIKVYYDRIKYDINIDLDNGSDVINYSLKYGATIPTIATPTKLGYDFTKFTSNNKDIDLTIPVSKDLDIKANYNAKTNTKYTIKYYQENLDDDDFVELESYRETQTGTTDTLANVNLDNDLFTGFELDMDKTISSGNINGDESLVLELFYKRKRFNVTYKYADGVTVDKVETLKYEARATEINVDRDGYAFNGWMYNNSYYNFNDPIYSDITLFASYQANSGIAYKVNYYIKDFDGEYVLDDYISESGYTGDEKYADLREYDYYGYTLNNELSNTKGNILADGSLELNLYYDRSTYTFIFVDSVTEELITTKEALFEQTFDMQSVIEKEGYKLRSTSLYKSNNGEIDGHITTYNSPEVQLPYVFETLYNNYGVTEYIIKVEYTEKTDTKYTVKVYYENIIDDDFTLFETVELSGKTNSQITPEEIEHFTFYTARGETEDDELIIKPDGSTVIRAYYKRNKYSVTFAFNNDSENLVLENIKYGSLLNPISVSKTGYTFSHWQNLTRNVNFDFNTDTIEGDTDLEANWIPNSNTEYTIRYYLQNVDDDEYSLYHEEKGYGTTEDSINGETNNYSSHVIDGAYYSSARTVKIKGDGSTVLELYYIRRTYTLWIYYDSGIIQLDSEISTYYSSIKYGSTINFNAELLGILGYEVDGIYEGNQKISNSFDYTYTVSKTTNIYFKVKKANGLENFSFDSDKENCIITGIETDVIPETIIIPDIVTEIGIVCQNQENLRKVIIGKNVKKINASAFENNYNLAEIEFSSEGVLETIEYEAFYGCNIKNLKIPKSVKIIGEHSFSNSNIETLTFEENSKLEEIKYQAFSYNLFNEIVLPNSLKKIGEGVFNNIVFNELIIPNQVTEISNSAFSGAKIKTLKFMEDTSLTVIPEYAFANSNIEKVIIPKEVTTISNSAFSGSNIKEVVFENNSNLETIGDNAFEGNLLSTIDLPNSVKIINNYAFYQGKTLLYVKLNSNLHEIGYAAFGNDAYPMVVLNGSSLNIEKGSNENGSVGYRAQYILNGEDVEKITIDRENKFIYYFSDTLDDESNIIHNKELIGYFGNERKVVIPDGVTKIAPYAFNKNDSIVSVIIPDSVKEIGDYAFYKCNLLTSVTLGSGLTEGSIGNEAFSECITLFEVINKSTELTLEKKSSENGSVAYYALDIITDDTYESQVVIDNDQFIKYSSSDEVYLINYIYDGIVNDLYISDDYTIVCKEVFYGNLHVKNIYIGSGVKVIGENAFASSSFETIEFASNSSLTTIEDNAFNYCWAIKEIIIPSSVKEIRNYAFHNCGNLNTFIFEEQSHLEYIGEYAFYSDINLKEIIFPNSLIKIDNYAFFDCSELKEITLGENLKEISSNAFGRCYALKEVNNNSTELEIIGEYAFYDCRELKQFTLNEVISVIEDNAFRGASILSIFNKSSLVLKKGSNEYGRIALNAINIYTNESENRIRIENDFIYYEELDEDNNLVDLYLLEYIGDNSEIEISADVTVIARNAFKNNDTIYNVTFEENSKLREIGDYAFYNCYISSLEMPSTIEKVGISGLESISSNLYYDNENDAYYIGNSENNYLILKEIGENFKEINEECKIIGKEVFNCREIEELVIPNSVKFICENAFINGIFGQITLPENISLISQCSFANATISSIVIPANVVKIDEGAFNNAKIESITFEDNSKLKTISEDAFSEAVITSITLPDSVEVIENYAFNNCSNLEEFNITSNSSLRIIGDYAFNQCSSLRSIYLPITLEIIGEYAFNECSNLEIVDIENNSNLTTIGDRAFKNCISLKSINFGDNSKIEKIGFETFSNCTMLQTVTFGENSSLSIIDEYAFIECSSLESFNIGENGLLKEIRAYAFKDCYELTSFIMPETIEKIYEYAFYNCYKLENIGINEDSNLLDIMNYAFAYTAIKELTLPKTLKTIGNYAFYKCNQLEKIETKENSEIESIGSYAFYNCEKLSELNLLHATHLEIINESAFNSCQLLHVIILPEGLKELGHSAFYNVCNDDSLNDDAIESYIIIPSSLKTIYGSSLYSSQNYFSEIYYNGTCVDWILLYTNKNDMSSTINNYLSSNNNEVDLYLKNEEGTIEKYGNNYDVLEEVIIPNTIEILPNSIFYKIKSIKYIILPTSISYIYDYALYGLDNTKIYYEGDKDNYASQLNIYYGNDILNYNLYIYSDEYIDDGNKYWHYVDSKPVEYDFEIALEKMNLLDTMFKKYINLNEYLGSDPNTSIIEEEGNRKLNLNALRNCLELDYDNPINTDEDKEIIEKAENIVNYFIIYDYIIELTLNGGYSYEITGEDNYLSYQIVDNNGTLTVQNIF